MNHLKRSGSRSRASRCRVPTHGVGLGGLDVHVAGLLDGLHHQFLRAGKEALNVRVGEAEHLGEPTAEHDG